MTTSNLNVAHSDGVSSPDQLSLPVGLVGLVRPRREPAPELPFMAACRETTTDRDGKKLPGSRKVVFLALASRVSPAQGPTCWPSLATIGRDSGLHVATVIRALVDLEKGFLISVERGGGRQNNVYTVLPVVPHSTPKEKPALAQCDSSSRRVRDKEEGRANKENKNPLSAVAQTLDPDAVEEVEIPEEVICLPFPSLKQEQEQEQEQKASAPVPEETVFVNENQVKLLFKLQRKLGYRADDGQAGVFDGLEHADRKRILDKLLAEEQLAAAQGKVTAPPKAEPSPRHKFPLPVARNKVRERPVCETHRWTPPASDGISNCVNCDAEKTNER